MIQTKRLLPRQGGALGLGAAILGCFATLLSFTTVAHADYPPNPEQVQLAQKTSDLMLASVVAALLQEFAETTPANVEEGKKSISLIFNDANKDMRLVGTLQPLRNNDVPQDSFETAALARAMQGENYTDTHKVQESGFTAGRWRSATSIRCARCSHELRPR